MLRKSALILLASAICLCGAACKKEQTQAEKKAEVVAAFKAKQKAAAVKNYQDLIANYPASPFAAQAKAKLQALGAPAAAPAASPAPKK